MKKLIICLLLFPVLTAFSQIKMKRRQLKEGISTLVPDEFRLLEYGEKLTRYKAFHQPEVMFSGKEDRVTLSVHSPDRMPWEYRDLDILHKFYRSNIYSLYGEVNMLRDEIALINGHQFAVMEFLADVKDENAIFDRKAKPVYTYVAYTVNEGGVLVVNFTCPMEIHREWKKAAADVINNLKVRQPMGAAK